MVKNEKYSHRIGKAQVKLRNANGSPLMNQIVTIRQTKHAFLFGCGEFYAAPYVNGQMKGEDEAKIKSMFDKFFDIFNFATLPFYWGNFEREKGKPDTQRFLKAAEFLKSKGLTLKGHPLCWHSVCAPWLLDMSNEEILATQLQRINRDVTDFKGLIDMWDVINEVVIMPIFNKYDNGITRICKELDRIKLVRKVFEAARNANPGAYLLINDFNTSESYDILLEGILEAGIHIDAIGIQSHMHQGYWGVEKTLEVLERFSRFKLPIHFTENTLVSGHIMPPEIEDLNDYQIESWPSTPDGEDRQARETALHYQTLFSHPQVASVTWWDFIDGSWLGAPSGFITKDARVKPVYSAVHQLIKEDWWMKPTQATTDENGNIEVEGFLGDYEVQYFGQMKSFSIKSEKTEQVITVV